MADGAVGVAADEDGGVLDFDGGAATFGAVALIDEDAAGAGYRDNVARKVVGEVHEVRVQVAGDAGAGHVFIHAPEEGHGGVHGPVLQIEGAEMVDAADAAFVDQLAGEGDGGNT